MGRAAGMGGAGARVGHALNIIADPDKPLLIVHSRGQGDALTTRLIADPATRLRLDPPGLEVDLSEVLVGAHPAKLSWSSAWERAVFSVFRTDKSS